MKKRILIIFFIIGCLLMTSCSKKTEPRPDPIDDNYRVFYEIFTGSFSDSDGDGIGDLNGIINRLDYLNDGNMDSGNSLGIQGIWLTPIFKSPSYHKYDVQDYYTIDPAFGTQEDLDRLIEECHKRNIILILDMVINHTSRYHPWFSDFYDAHRSGKTDDPYYDFYTYDIQYEAQPGKAWCDIDNAGQVYECNFSSDMPELNFDNPKVREEVLDIAKFYLDKGVDGFRFDAAKYIYLSDNGRSVDFWKWYCDELRKIKEDVYLVAEVWSHEGEIDQYETALNCFNFSMSQAEGIIAKTAKGSDMKMYTHYISSYQDKLKSINSKSMPIPFISNHDMDRAAGYLSISDGKAFFAANLYLLSPGSPFLYYGEEIGMKGSRGAANTDANRRLAMLWGDNDTISDPEGSTYDITKQINGTVIDQTKDKNSLLNYYRDLIQIRNRYPQIARGTYNFIDLDNSNLGGFSIEYNGETTYLFHNNSSEEITIAADTYSELLDHIGMNSASFKDGKLTIGAMTSVILK